MKKVLMVSAILLSAGIFRSVWAGDVAPLDSAPARIARIRTRGVTVRVLDKDGNPVIGRFRAEMIRHQFLFGCNIFMFGKMPTAEENERYLERWSVLFNYATVPFYLSQYQPRPDKTREAKLKEMANWCASKGIRVKGHPLIWHSPWDNPKWLPKDMETLEEIYQARIKDLVEKFKPEIQYWDVLNEPTAAWMFDSPVANWENRIGPLAVAKKGLEWAAQANPEAKLLINDYNLNENPIRRLNNINDPINHYENSYYQFLSDLMSQDGKYHAIGIQSHMQWGKATMEVLWRACERYSKLGLPIHFTEVTVLSGRKITRPDPLEFNRLWWPSTEEGEAEQAEYAENFYTLLFSHPAVEAITWWDFTDRGSWMGAPAGLVRKDLSPKPAYDRLLHLIREEWWTNFEGDTDSQGGLSFRGYCGDYLLHLTDAITSVPFSIKCGQKDGQAIDIHL